MSEEQRKDVFRALSHPLRRRIIEKLHDEPASVTDLAQGWPTSLPVLSQHLKVLRETGLVKTRREGSRHIYKLQNRRLGDAKKWVDRQLEE
jgi:DNA-binding transcriptional ArsR family regulator